MSVIVINYGKLNFIYVQNINFLCIVVKFEGKSVLLLLKLRLNWIFTQFEGNYYDIVNVDVENWILLDCYSYKY